MKREINLDDTIFHVKAVHERAGEPTITKRFAGLSEAVHFAKDYQDLHKDQLMLIEAYDHASGLTWFISDAGKVVNFPYYWGLNYPNVERWEEILQTRG